jgi:hypothetical protein
VAPGWIGDPDSFWHWLHSTIEDSGGILLAGIPVQAGFVELDDGNVAGLIVPTQSLVFGASTVLTFSMVVDEAANETEYSFHHGELGGDMLWRACRNDHYLTLIGSEFHLHLPGEFGVEAVLAHRQIDIGDAIDAIHHERVP